MKIPGGWMLAFFLLIGCGDNSSPSGGTKCSGALYDKCAGASGCTSGMCQSSPSIGMFCTQTCSPGQVCPAQYGTAVTCNNMGICLPPATNSCSL
jgi:hypothetical protein